MSERKRATLVPGYMKDFRCIGSACEDSCCIGWRVDIDHETYKRYHKINDSELTPLMDAHISRNRSVGKGENNYARIKLLGDSRCPLLDEEMLCRVQVKRGEEFLSDVCATYPRITNIVNGVLERSATMSCPEAARLALLNTEGIEFDEGEEAVSVKNIIKANINTHDLKLNSKPHKYLWELRIFTITLLQDRSYLLWERLIILGMFFQKLQKHVDNGSINEIPELIASYTNLIENGGLRENLSSIPAQYAIQMELLKEIAEKRYFQGVNNKRYLECFGEFLYGIQYVSGASVEDIGLRYKEAYENYYVPFMEEHGHILENYLVNHVFKNLFPVTGEKSFFDSYMMVVLHYALIKMHLIGMAALHKGLSVGLVIKLMQSFAKTVEHSPVYLNGIAELMRQNGFNTMPYMSILIKN